MQAVHWLYCAATSVSSAVIPMPTAPWYAMLTKSQIQDRDKYILQALTSIFGLVQRNPKARSHVLQGPEE